MDGSFVLMDIAAANWPSIGWAESTDSMCYCPGPRMPRQSSERGSPSGDGSRRA